MAPRSEQALMEEVAQVRVKPVLDQIEKYQLALDGMLGVRAALASGVRPFRGLREAYVEITRDEQFRIDGIQGHLFRIRGVVSTTSLPDLLLNSLNKRLIQNYNDIGWGGLDRIVKFVGTKNFQTNSSLRLGYFPDLATVAESGAFVEIANPSDDLISYDLLKKGNAFTMTEETIRNDDLSGLRAIPERLARAGIRTAKRFVTAMLTTPGNYEPDAVAVFHATHNNLGSVALGAAELDAREAALFAQAEPASAEKLGLRLDWIVIPYALDSTARKINNDRASNWEGRFGPAGSESPRGIIVNELLSDANDWYYGTDGGPFIEVGTLFGEDGKPPIPTIILANEPEQGAEFTQDRAIYKARLAFGGDYVDFRTAGKNVVA